MDIENVQTAPAQSDVSTESASVNTSTPAAETVQAAKTESVSDKLAKVKSQAKEGALVEPATKEATPVTPETPAFTPNFKYKAALQEKEIDEFWRGLIKDAESEKKVKELFTRADAFEYMKEKSTKREEEYQSLYQDFETQARVVNKVMEAKKAGDFDSVFRNIGMSDHEVIQWAAKRVDYLQMLNQMPPDQRQALERQQQAAFQATEYEEQISQLTTERQALAAQARATQLDMVLSRPEINHSAAFWDEKMGNPGAFRNMVIDEAKMHFYLTQQQTGQGVDLSAEQAVAHVLKKFGSFVNAQQMGGQQAPNAQVQSTPGPQAPADRPVIPAVSGASKTPIKKQALSLDDIKKRAAELKAQQSAQL